MSGREPVERPDEAPRAPGGMAPADVRPGVRVDYHAIIGGPVTQVDLEVRSEPWQLGDGRWVVLLQGRIGGVSLDALTPTWCCRACGCTERHACPGGCSWIAPNLCSRCGPGSA